MYHAAIPESQVSGSIFEEKYIPYMDLNPAFLLYVKAYRSLDESLLYVFPRCLHVDNCSSPEMLSLKL